MSLTKKVLKPFTTSKYLSYNISMAIYYILIKFTSSFTLKTVICIFSVTLCDPGYLRPQFCGITTKLIWLYTVAYI